ncbi:hypothetical protein [uncultured Capnocytophaga sp.]|uniref:hypothetical protein n=1 Tax=uncultured Capnocytophaga sp. TaxID=159273 RepID=UPI0025994282|nr:hypothetical protein [uncultured Capnocytophaga sp.]
MSHKIIKFGMLALVALALTYCQREDAPEAPQQAPVPAVDPQAVVSLNEAKSLFEASENQKRTANSVSRRKYPFIELETDWRYFVQTQTLVGDAYSKIPVTIVGSDLSAEMLFLKEDGVTEPYLFITEPDSLTNDNRIVNADFYLFTPKGEFISAYRMTDGVISHQLVPKVKANYRLVVDAEAAQTGRKKPKKTKGTPASIRVEGKTEDSGGLKDESGGGGAGGGTGGGFGGDAPIQLETVDVYGTRPVHYGSYPTYNGNDYGNFTKGKDPKLDENGIGGGNGGDSGSRSSDVGVGIAKNMKTIDDEEEEEKLEENIIDKLTDPCASAVLAQAPTLPNDIAKILRETFGTNDKFNITVRNYSFAVDRDHKDDVAYTNSSGSPTAQTLNCNIYLNDDVIKGASQEYILATIYHEVIHSFLIYELQTLGEKVFNQKYPSVYSKEFFVGNRRQKKMYVFIDDKQDHNKFSNFIESLAQSIMSLPGTQISLETARAMAKVGVVENESLSERENYLNNQQKLGKSGMTCTPKIR